MSAASIDAGASALSKLEILALRSEMLAKARSFFRSRGLIEVDVPLLVQGAPLDEQIDLFSLETPQGRRFLHSSPEYGMKRLLAQGCPDCFQISHVFRAGELSARHQPEFTMAEWYRRGWALEELIEETRALIELFLGPLPLTMCSYWDLLQEALHLDCSHFTQDELVALCAQKGIALSQGAASLDRTALVQLLFATHVEPHLGRAGLDVVVDWPADQAALARKRTKDERTVAQRFEIYAQGIELCNGYDELIDPQEQRLRFEETNQHRRRDGKDPYPLDERFLEALPSMPDSVGVALGLDRLFQMALHLPQLADVLPWSWEDA